MDLPVVVSLAIGLLTLLALIVLYFLKRPQKELVIVDSYTYETLLINLLEKLIKIVFLNNQISPQINLNSLVPLKDLNRKENFNRLRNEMH